MTEFALIRSGAVHNVIVADQDFADSIASDWDDVVRVDTLIPKPGIDWTYAAGVFAPPEPPPVYAPASPGALGVFFESHQPNGYQWHYVTGPVIFDVKDATPASSAQPTISAAKAYANAHATDEQFFAALDWAITYRDRLVAGLTAAGVADPSASTRVVKLNNLISAIGGML